MKLTSGDKLRNGATLLAFKDDDTGSGYVVFAVIDKKGIPEYVTWWMDKQGCTISGRYHQTISAATTDYESRKS